ncbi:hypothetical protein [Pseudomonas sp. KNUC1026]|uniref:hypothetical protein n=1 Tax=Pseudomonas sp. KNUC1026 TaxID=2893890 RepID=UPI001F407F97|nr:hypothetical protein [Pseudomonas sp. KNUC1026]UFH48427.1 hypothetical protein LN139_15020 [Pseudomonas sp. KNUC1026]
MPLNPVRELPEEPAFSGSDLNTLQREALSTLTAHIDVIFALDLKFPGALSDDALSTEAEQALSRPAIDDYFITVFNLPTGARLELSEKKSLARALCTTALPYGGAPWLSKLEALPVSVSGYRIAYLAQLLVPVLSARISAHSAWPAFAIAALLLDPPAITEPSPARSRLDVSDTLELDRLVAFMLRSPEPAKALLGQLELDTYALAYYLRPLTAEEAAAGVSPDHAGKRVIRDALPPGKEHQALDALLTSPAFERWAANLAEHAGWSVAAQARPANHALAAQALVDTLYPIRQRMPGQIMGLDLFDPARAQVPFEDVRADLANHIMQTLGCPLSHAQIASQALLRHLAPELLIDDVPGSYLYQPSLPWVSLRLGAYALLDDGKPLSFQAAMQAVAAAAQALEFPVLYSERFNEVAWVWATQNSIIDPSIPHLDDTRHYAEQRLLQAMAMEQLSDVPNRAAEAWHRLVDAGVDHQQLPEMMRCYLENHGRFELPGSKGQSLDDINPWFEERFETYLNSARHTFKAVLSRLIALLPLARLQHFHTLPGTAYAVTWPHYKGGVKGGVPGFADSPQVTGPT